MTYNQLYGQGRARREAARRHKVVAIPLAAMAVGLQRSGDWPMRRTAGQSPLRCRPTALGIAASGASRRALP